MKGYNIGFGYHGRSYPADKMHPLLREGEREMSYGEKKVSKKRHKKKSRLFLRENNRLHLIEIEEE